MPFNQAAKILKTLKITCGSGLARDSGVSVNINVDWADASAASLKLDNAHSRPASV